MLKKLFLLIYGIVFTFLPSPATEPEIYLLDVKDFSELQVVDNLNVIHRCNPDSAGYATFTCTPDLATSVIFSNNKNKLKIQKNTDLTLNDLTFPTITVYSNYLVSVENSGDSTVIIDSPAAGALFKARIIGNGKLLAYNIHATQTEGNLDTGKGYMYLEGNTRLAKLKNIGTGIIRADKLNAKLGSVTILGTGAVYCKVEEDVTVKGMGSGKVYVTGNPTIKKRSIGNIEVINEK